MPRKLTLEQRVEAVIKRWSELGVFSSDAAAHFLLGGISSNFSRLARLSRRVAGGSASEGIVFALERAVEHGEADQRRIDQGIERSRLVLANGGSGKGAQP